MTLRRLGAQRHVGDLPPDEGQIVGEVRRGYQHNSVPRRRRCTEGRLHKWELDDTCRNCGDHKALIYCWFYNCGEDADLYFERWVTRSPNAYGLMRGEQITYPVARDQGTCDWCIERHRREDTYQANRAIRDIDESRYLTAYFRRSAERKEREEQWRTERVERQETARQRHLLRQGHQTLTAIRRHLRGADPLPPLESRPARTSQI